MQPCSNVSSLALARWLSAERAKSSGLVRASCAERRQNPQVTQNRLRPWCPPRLGAPIGGKYKSKRRPARPPCKSRYLALEDCAPKMAAEISTIDCTSSLCTIPRGYGMSTTALSRVLGLLSYRGGRCRCVTVDDFAVELTRRRRHALPAIIAAEWRQRATGLHRQPARAQSAAGRAVHSLPVPGPGFDVTAGLADSTAGSTNRCLGLWTRCAKSSSAGGGGYPGSLPGALAGSPVLGPFLDLRLGAGRAGGLVGS